MSASKYLIPALGAAFAVAGGDKLLGDRGGQGRRSADGAHLLLGAGDRKRGVGGDPAGHAESERFKVRFGDDVTQEAQPKRPLRWKRVSGAEHLKRRSRASPNADVEQAIRVVGKTKLGRRERKRAGRVSDDDVAAEDQVGAAAPSGPVHHGDDRRRVVLHAAEQTLQRPVPRQWVEAPGQRPDVEAGAPHLRPLTGPQDDGTAVPRFIKGPGQGGKHPRRKDVAPLRRVHGNDGDVAIALDGHEQLVRCFGRRNHPRPIAAATAVCNRSPA